MIASGPSSSPRLGSAAMSSWPTWTPSASQLAGQVGIVVDDEEGAVGVGDAAEGLRRRARSRAAAELLLAQLDDVGAAAQRRAQQRLRVVARAGGRRRRSRGGRSRSRSRRSGPSPSGSDRLMRSIMAGSRVVLRARRRGSIGGAREPARAERVASRPPTVWT